MKRCSKCRVEKDEATDFHKDSRTGKARAWCRSCTNADNLARAKSNPEKTAARSRAWRKANPERAASLALAAYHRDPERSRANRVRSRFKVDWQTLWEQQQGLCACCGEPMLREGREKLSAVVDHDRSCCAGSTSCGECVRGMIHWRCNVILGYANDNAALLRQAAAYLDRLG
jgi:hypothetical protein